MNARECVENNSLI